MSVNARSSRSWLQISDRRRHGEGVTTGSELGGGLEQLDRVAVGIFQLDLLAARAGLHLVAKLACLSSAIRAARSTDPRGPNRPEWAKLTGRYEVTFIGAPTSAELSVRNGYLYLNRSLKLIELEAGRFTTADNEDVRADGRALIAGNRRYTR